MIDVVPREHLDAANKLREILATYRENEDLINIGALSPGSNRRIDGAVALIDRIRDFLVQPVRERTDFSETVERLIAIVQSWDDLLGGQS